MPPTARYAVAQKGYVVTDTEAENSADGAATERSTGDSNNRWALLDTDDGVQAPDGGSDLLEVEKPRLDHTAPAALPADSEAEALDAATKELSQRRGSKLAVVASGITELGEMTQMGGHVIVDAVLHPVGYWGDVRDQMHNILRLCWMPMIVSCFAFGMGAPGLQGGNIYNLFGIPDRLGSFFIMASVREFAPWINAMVVAGVVGTAITADLGARRIREEIDALEVLGIDVIRTLVLPRVIALFLMTGLLDLLALACGIAGGFVAAVPILGASSGAFVGNFFANANVVDLLGSVIKTSLFGLFIGIVCCYKGLHTKGGPSGVGRAVNQAVVVSFAVIWVFNYVFTATMLGLFPGIQVFR
jgi:phospholipid/cholesterol/gamma-HCH transport system permease protein